MFDSRKYLRIFAGTDSGDENTALRKFYSITVGLMGCFIVCTHLITGNLFKIQERETEVVRLAGQSQLLGEQSARAATEIIAHGVGEPPMAARLIGLLEEWAQCRQTLGAELGLPQQQSLPLAGEGAQALAAVKQDLAAPVATRKLEHLQLLARAVLETQPRLLESSSGLVANILARAQTDKSRWRSTGLVVVVVMVLVIGLQFWRGSGDALRVLRDQRSREAAVLQEVQTARDTIARMTRHQELILNFAGEAIWGVDQYGRTTFVNPAATRLTLWQGDELLGLSQHEALRHSDKHGVLFDAASCPVCRTFRDGDEHHANDDTFYRKDGTYFPVEYQSMPLREEGQIVGAVLTFKDIGENRSVQSKLMQAQKLESIGQLAAGIAHEINTPTQYVSDNTRFLKDAFYSLGKVMEVFARLLQAAKQQALSEELIQDAQAVATEADLEYLTEEVPKAIDQSLDGLSRIARIVGAMKEFSHPDGDAKSLTDINRAIESTVTVARNEWKYVAEMELQLDPDLPPVFCLTGSFNQVILNLVVNAAHAIAELVRDTESKGKIRITTSRTADGVAITVSDTGKGIPAAIRSRVFDPFFTTKPVGKGTGQGLAIAYSVVVEKHGGSISFESEVGQGTTFHIHLPIQSDTSEEGAAYETADCAG